MDEDKGWHIITPEHAVTKLTVRAEMADGTAIEIEAPEPMAVKAVSLDDVREISWAATPGQPPGAAWFTEGRQLAITAQLGAKGWQARVTPPERPAN